MIEKLKNKIILDSEWSVGLFHRIFRLNQDLKKEIHDILTVQMESKEMVAREQKLNYLINQLNYLFYESSKGKSQFCELTQSIYRQLNIFETIAWFINDSQRKIKDESKNSFDIFSTCFEFISNYLYDS